MSEIGLIWQRTLARYPVLGKGPDEEVTVENALHELRDWLLEEHSLTISADRLTAITPYLRQIVEDGVPGTVVELGCHRGAMSVWIRSVLDLLGDTEREIHVYDSFQGLPAPDECDSDHVGEGDLLSSGADVLKTHDRWAKRPPIIHPGWFEDTLPDELPDLIAFGYLDGDFYSSIMTSLKHCTPRLSARGIFIIDDYADVVANPAVWNGLPGVKKACDDYFGEDSPVEPIILVNSDLPLGLYRHRVRG